jgi:lipopolysaccharide/colanic/teichoic acid biosynthesis glycosyltransferase
MAFRLIDWIIAFMLLLMASPIILGLVLLMQVYSPGLVFSRDWHVGEAGKLFRAIQFHTTANHSITPLGHWMRKYNLHNLPQLCNVVQGDRSLFGSRCWTLEDAVQLSSERQLQLNKFPGIASNWEVCSESNLLHLDGQAL